jgi:hypothetical protein
MVGLFDRIKIILGRKAKAEVKSEPVISQPQDPPVEVQVSESVDNKVYYDFLRVASELQKHVEVLSQQAPEVSHAGELERFKQYAELAKQNKIDNDALNEDLE